MDEQQNPPVERVKVGKKGFMDVPVEIPAAQVVKRKAKPKAKRKARA